MGLISNGSTIFDNGSMASGFGGSLVFLAKQSITSPVSSVEFVDGSGGVDFTSYKEYIFYFLNLHPNSNTEPYVSMNFSTDGGSNYNVTKTSSAFYSRHAEDNAFASISYQGLIDLAQSTSDQLLVGAIETDNDSSMCGFMHLYNPSSSTYVKHYTMTIQYMHDYPASWQHFIGGYANTTSPIDAVIFKGGYSLSNPDNIDSGEILLFGVN